MKIISHRGNINGQDFANENTQHAIDKCIDIGLDVEIDIRYINNQWWLGHDSPDYFVDLKWLEDRAHYLWIHAKNFGAVSHLQNTNFNWFWHDTDKITLTSKGNIWCFPGVFIPNGITVTLMPSEYIPDDFGSGGICTDHPNAYIS